MRRGPATLFSIIWLIGVVLLTAHAIFFHNLISAVLANAYAIVSLTIALWATAPGGGR